MILSTQSRAWLRKPLDTIGEFSMDVKSVAAIIFVAVTVGAVGFQLALAMGAPWGAYAMGGTFPGRFPAPMRVAAIVQALVLTLLAAVVIARSGLALDTWAPAASWLIWVVVAFAAVSLVLNSITPSAVERRVWAPVAIMMLGSSLVVALIA